MTELLTLNPELAWSAALFISWLAGELCHRMAGLPRISSYGIVGFLLGQTQSGFLPSSQNGNMMLLADIALGLILFEMGCRINLRWLRCNPWLTLTGLLEASCTFAVVYAAALWFGTSMLTAMLVAALLTSTSPAAVLRVVNEHCSSGQVTERTLHLTAMNSVLAVIAFKLIVGAWIFQSTGNIAQAVWSGLVVLLASIAVGGLLGIAVPSLLRALGHLERDATVAFAITVILGAALAHALSLSSVLTALTYGLVVRHRRITLNRAQRSFGSAGNLLTVLLFTFAASTIQWQRVTAGALLALPLVLLRFAVKSSSVALLAKISGISWKKGLLTGMALTPMSVFVILLLEHTRQIGIGLVDQLAPLAAATLLLEVAGPVITTWALHLAEEIPDTQEK